MGTPQQCVEQLEMFHEDYGVDYFTVRFRMPTGPSLEAAAEQITRFGEEVVQPIHKKYPAPVHPAIPKTCQW
jgi:alkanesulfonate monooxygenase SsuD/methylene tetrahydromethanopterin reductase-like flavin-dependent oxidoreductase (luciferase family)